MKYLLLIYQAESVWESRTEPEQRAIIAKHAVLNETLTADGIEFAAEPLQPTSTARCVTVEVGERHVVDGPFAETREQLAGFYLVDVADVEAALDYAAMIPAAEAGRIEVRPVADHSALAS